MEFLRFLMAAKPIFFIDSAVLPPICGVHIIFFSLSNFFYNKVRFDTHLVRHPISSCF